MAPWTWNWKKIIGIIALSVVCFILANVAYDSFKSWRTRMAAKKAAAIGNGGTAKA